MTDMTFVPTPSTSIMKWIATQCRRRNRPAGDVDDACTRRAFVQETIWRNPQAFESDLGTCAMMTMFPRDF
jgi:hypothetical protein